MRRVATGWTCVAHCRFPPVSKDNFFVAVHEKCRRYTIHSELRLFDIYSVICCFHWMCCTGSEVSQYCLPFVSHPLRVQLFCECYKWLSQFNQFFLQMAAYCTVPTVLKTVRTSVNFLTFRQEKLLVFRSIRLIIRTFEEIWNYQCFGKTSGKMLVPISNGSTALFCFFAFVVFRELLFQHRGNNFIYCQFSNWIVSFSFHYRTQLWIRFCSRIKLCPGNEFCYE